MPFLSLLQLLVASVSYQTQDTAAKTGTVIIQNIFSIPGSFSPSLPKFQFSVLKNGRDENWKHLYLGVYKVSFFTELCQD